MEQFLLVAAIYVIYYFALTDGVIHETSVMWTEKGIDGNARIVSIIGDPEEWVTTGLPEKVGIATPYYSSVRQVSSRIALGFRYSTQHMFWSDRGFKEIMRATLQEVDNTPYLFNSTVGRVFTGTSTEVNGLAVDWLSGAIYWTDALYNWITVAASEDYEIFKHIIPDGLDKPMGICVYPAKGLMFWSDWGAVPKIEQADLAGENRVVLANTDLGQPRGMTIDYTHDHLYWVDDFYDTINRMDISDSGFNTHRTYFHVDTLGPNQHSGLFGIAVYKDYLFVTDQTYKTLKVLSRTEETLISSFLLYNLPYDVMMYDAGLQEQTPTACSTLGCQHICVSEAAGGGRCLCAESYALADDGFSCIKEDKIAKPSFLYTIGKSLCGTRINFGDRGNIHPGDDIDFFYNNLTHARALAFHSKAEQLFFSESDDDTVERIRLVGGFQRIPIAVQTGVVKGIDVDWITELVYWTEEDTGSMYVSRLDGRYQTKIMADTGAPRGIALNPSTGLMYWTDGAAGVIWRANMDGTNQTQFVYDMTPPEGISIDISEGRLYWAENHGVKSVQLNGKDKKTLILDYQNTYKDVTIFQDIFAYTDGLSGVFYAAKSTGTEPRMVQHIQATVSHDIIAYGDYLQPNIAGKCDDPTIECSQLCLPRVDGFVCACAYGFTLASDGVTCTSNLVDNNFALFADPYHRQIYQLDLSSPSATFQAVPMTVSEFPTTLDLDIDRGYMFWLEQEAGAIKKVSLAGGMTSTAMTFASGESVSEFVLSSVTKWIIYADANSHTIKKASFSGQDKSVIVNSPSSAKKLTLDDSTGYLYWVESNSKSYIYRQFLSGPANKMLLWESQTLIRDLTIDKSSNKLYWCTATQIVWSNMDGAEVSVLTAAETNSDFSNLAVTADHIYYTHSNRKALYRKNKQGGDIEMITEPIFSRITDLKEFSWITESTGGNWFTTGEATNVPLLVGVVSGVGGLLLVVLIIAVVIWKHCGTRKLPPTDFEAQSHENPTYASSSSTNAAITTLPSTPEVPEPIYHTLPHGRPASAGSRDSDLPDVVKLPLPEEEAEAVGSGVEPVSQSDKEQLVSASSVSLNLNDSCASNVTYNPNS